MLRTALLAAAGSPACRSLVERTPLTRPVVHRFVAGSTVDDALAVTANLIGSGRAVTLDHLGEDTTDPSMAAATVKAYAELLTLLADHGLAPDAEVSVKLSAVGLRLPDGDRVALDNARRICAAAAAAGTTVTLDMEDHTTTDAALGVLRELRADFPWVGAVLQAYLRRTEQDCRDLAYAGSRVRLCKGAYAEPASVAYPDKSEVDRSYVRCLRVLMDGAGHPMVATHDPRMIAIAAELGKDRPDWEFQMLYGVRDAEQRRLARDHAVRVYLPYGDEWYGYFMRRLAERPANLAFFLRALVTR
ncbi:proline dehydrogenase family protein [Amycolatopsis tucumanensis]|uniref:proline dehydrogenase n=1 Tax=Amycolatopsis tucumanensis TaxID=401106 RepID=A0ABP7JUW7_9PSEU|nr:proline dehydrogenase family protein [Amycolatopsis tucumanensis]MCF6426419.1 proline dehydrogenase family protein [Amycolatopsis tucumanensis]